jgi:hypothetical protein
MVGFKIQVDKNELLDLIDEQLDQVADFIFTKSQENIVNKSIVDEGTLLKSGNINRKYLDKEVVYSVPYADSIEFGRMPGQIPPITPIKLWVQRKLGVSDEKEANRIAWAIAQDIKKNGTDPRPFLTPAIAQAKKRFKAK